MAYASTAPYGCLEPPFDVCDLMVGAGASFVARTTAFHPKKITLFVERALEKKGFTVVEVLSNCHTTYGRRNKMPSSVEMMKWFKQNTLDAKRWEKTPINERIGKFKAGVFQDIESLEYIQNYEDMARHVMENYEEKKKKAKEKSPPEIPPRDKEYAEPVKFRFSGAGGQGLILAGVIYGRAASIYDGLNATQTQSYGPEARGGASKSDVIICDCEIDHPVAEELDALLCLNRESYDKYKKNLKPDGTLVVDALYVPDLSPEEGYSIHFTEIAQNVIGKAIVANVVALGALSVLVPYVSREALIASLKQSVPSAFVELNLKAFDEGAKAAREAAKE